MMNDKDFREKCRKISSANVDHFIYESDLNRHGLLIYHEADADLLKTSALLYIAANMPSANNKNKKPCKLCGNSKTIDCTGADLDGGIDHYFYINTKQKQLIEVNGKSEVHVSIKYCPMCGREI